jgi:hypothetical protein
VAHQRLQCNEVATTLAEEAIGEAVSELVRGERANPGSFADAPDHPHERLCAGGLLRVLLAPDTLVLGDPLLYLDREHVIVELRFESAEERSKLSHDVGIEW